MEPFESRLVDLLQAHTAIVADQADVVALARRAMAGTPTVGRGPRMLFRERRVAWALVGVAALLALVASLLFAGSQPLRDQDVRILPAVIPEGIENGRFESPLGPVRWAHLTGDAVSLPDPLTPQVGPDGLVWSDRGGPRQLPCADEPTRTTCAVTMPPRLWTSEDALAPRVEHALPVRASTADLSVDGETYWLVSAGPSGLWRSVDLEAWESIDLTGLRTPAPAGLDWDIALGAPRTVGDLSLMPLYLSPRDLGRFVGFPGVVVHLETIGGGAYRVLEHRLRSEGEDRELAIVRIDETASGLRFSDATGATIAELAGADDAFIDAWVTNGVTTTQLGLVDGSRVVTLDGRWSSDLEPPTVFPVGNDYVAYQVGSDGTVSTWQSGDGHVWVPGGRLGEGQGAAWQASSAYVDTTGREPTIKVLGADGTHGWASSDGVTWTTFEALIDGSSIPFGSGWIRWASSGGAFWTSLDGVTWSDAPEFREVITKTESRGAGGSGVTTVGGSMYFTVVEESVPLGRDVWIFESG
jgi:hypothetical protein